MSKKLLGKKDITLVTMKEMNKRFATQNKKIDEKFKKFMKKKLVIK